MPAFKDGRAPVTHNQRRCELELNEKKRLFVRTGSALRGYVPGTKSCISKALYKPCSLGFPMGEVEWKRCREGGEYKLLKELHSWA